MEKKIAKWQAEGLIDSETALKLLADVKEDKAKKRRLKVNITIYTVAVILLGIGVITFVASNNWIWELLNSSGILKILIIFSATCLSLWGGYELAYNKKIYLTLGNALVFLSSLLIGATYALIGQIYNINANASSLFLLWLISILPVAYLFKNSAVNIISIVLIFLSIISFYAELSLDELLIWTIFIPVLCGLILYTCGNIPFILNNYNKFSFSYKISGIVPIFVTLLVLTCSVEHSYHITSLFYYIPIMVVIVVNLFNYFSRSNRTTLLKIETGFLLLISVLMLLLLVMPEVSTPAVMILANIGLIAIITFGFNYGYKFENLRIISTTNWMLTIYLVVNYCRWGWSLMNKSLFFIVGGVTLIALGVFLERKRKEVGRKVV